MLNVLNTLVYYKEHKKKLEKKKTNILHLEIKILYRIGCLMFIYLFLTIRPSTSYMYRLDSVLFFAYFRTGYFSRNKCLFRAITHFQL